jgi:hypothetical protein
MCCFSQPVVHVSTTQIFARSESAERQFLVYSMKLEAKEPLAMILPLPVKAGSAEKSVKFIDLSGYEGFFDDLRVGFPVRQTRSATTKSLSAAVEAPLEVQKVGSFEASFVPTVADFSRLDARFRLPPGTFDQLPQYKSYGFAVFKLKPNASYHPMAFSFPRADPRLFFPTVHIHDGKVHADADFDHALFFQPATLKPTPVQCDESPDLASSFMNVKLSQGIIAADMHCYQRRIRGSHPNADTWV